MKTSLKFEGPADLSIGQIRISGAQGLVREWMATPDQRTMNAPSLTPGYYLAEIEPAGVSARSVVFTVQPGQANTVSMPDFSYLSASGSGTTFLGVDNPDQAMKSLFGFKPDEVLESALNKVKYSAELNSPNFEGSKIQTREPATIPETRLLSVGLSMEQPQRREGWASFDGSCSAELTSGAVALNIVPPADWSSHSGRRARLTVAIEGIRIERLLLPLYRGGTTVRITASTSSANDVALEVTPSDTAIRALWRAIDAGTRDHAVAVRDHVLKVKGPEPIAALENADPWEAMLAGLLYLRFPEEFGPLSAEWAAALCTAYPWAADSYAIRAKQASAAVALAPASIAENAALAVRMLIKAQSRGSPYFALANQYFNELVESLVSFEALDSASRTSIEKALNRWQRDLPLQRHAGTSFSWVSRDQALLKSDRILAPKSNVSGRLRASDTAIVFKGLIRGGAITFETPTTTAPKGSEIRKAVYPSPAKVSLGAGTDMGMPKDCPAFRRKILSPDDPNLGRFGRKAKVRGFTLSAHFPQNNPKMVAVELVVEAKEPSLLSIGDSVWFCLHPTFNPEWVRVFFRGGSATLLVRAWGGFTVGAWLPSQRIELECNLAAATGAPAIIRMR
jgi:hypothetical protein